VKKNLYLRAAILEVVDNQLQANDPPETKQTFKRLIAEGYSKKEAKELIGCVVTSEMFDVMKKQQPFNPERFAKALNRLPKLPWD
jgi:hypothetical protein